MSLLAEMETIVGDERYVYDFFELSLLVQRRIEQFDEWLDDYGKVFFFVVSTTVNLKKKMRTLNFENKYIPKGEYINTILICLCDFFFFVYNFN